VAFQGTGSWQLLCQRAKSMAISSEFSDFSDACDTAAACSKHVLKGVTHGTLPKCLEPRRIKPKQVVKQKKSIARPVPDQPLHQNILKASLSWVSNPSVTKLLKGLHHRWLLVGTLIQKKNNAWIMLDN